MISKVVFLLGLAVAASGLVSPPVALALGLVFGFAFPHPFDRSAKKLSRYLLQASVVGLGFGMNLHDVIRAGRSGFVYTVLASVSPWPSAWLWAPCSRWSGRPRF